MHRLLLALLLANCTSAQLTKTVRFLDPAISPDGATIAFTQTSEGANSARLYIRDTNDSQPAKPVRTASGTYGDSTPAFSPDSRTLAFFSTAGSKDQAQLWTLALPSTTAKKRTSLKGYAARPRFSPDGQSIAFLYIEGAEGGGPLLAAPAQTGVIEARIHNQRIAIFELATGKLRMASPGNLHVYDFDWSPDGKRFVITAAPGPGDNNWWIAKLFVVAPDSTANPIYEPKWQIAIPRWSPDSQTIAFVEGIMSDEGFHGGDLLTIHADGTGLVNRTRGRRTNVSSLLFTSPDRLLTTEWVSGASALTELSLSANAFHEVFRGKESLHAGGNFPNLALTPNGKMSVAVRSDFNTPPEVWAGPPGAWRQLTSANTSQTIATGKAESLTWQSDNFQVQGWLIPPKQIDPGKRHPMVVVIHGGPSNMAAPSWPRTSDLNTALSARGYYVFLPNPRGSYGQGEEFTQANIQDFGGGDLRDILKGVDTALSRHPIDPQRLGVTGWSYGGYMTMWTVTQTNRFRAAMAGAGIANWKSYYGQNLIDRWMIPFFGASVYDNPAVYAKSSPIEFIRQVKTPTLVIVGERDAECPAPQSFEFWHALRTLGVPTQLVVYAGEGHMFLEPENRKDMLDRTLQWFEKYLR